MSDKIRKISFIDRLSDRLSSAPRFRVIRSHSSKHAALKDETEHRTRNLNRLSPHSHGSNRSRARNANASNYLTTPQLSPPLPNRPNLVFTQRHIPHLTTMRMVRCVTMCCDTDSNESGRHGTARHDTPQHCRSRDKTNTNTNIRARATDLALPTDDRSPPPRTTTTTAATTMSQYLIDHTSLH